MLCTRSGMNVQTALELIQGKSGPLRLAQFHHSIYHLLSLSVHSIIFLACMSGLLFLFHGSQDDQSQTKDRLQAKWLMRRALSVSRCSSARVPAFSMAKVKSSSFETCLRNIPAVALDGLMTSSSTCWRIATWKTCWRADC